MSPYSCLILSLYLFLTLSAYLFYLTYLRLINVRRPAQQSVVVFYLLQSPKANLTRPCPRLDMAL